MRIRTAGVGTCSMLWSDGSPSRGVLVRIDFVIENHLRVAVSSYSSEIGFRNIFGPDTSISTQVLPEGQSEKSNTVGHHCYVPRKKKKENFKTAI